MSDTRPIRRLFAPSTRRSLLLAIVAILTTIGMFLLLNCGLESYVKERAGYEEAARVLEIATGKPSVQLSGASIKFDPFDISTAWGVFSTPLTEKMRPTLCADNNDTTNNKSARKPLPEFLYRMRCVESIYNYHTQASLNLNETLKIDSECGPLDLIVGRPAEQRGDGENQLLMVINGLLPGATGVTTSKGLMSWLRGFSDPPELGAFIQDKEQITNSRALYHIVFTNNRWPNSIMNDPNCRPLRDVLDSFSIAVIDGYQGVVDTTPIIRWFLRAINGPIQALIVALTIWGCLRLLDRRAREKRIAMGKAPDNRIFYHDSKPDNQSPTVTKTGNNVEIPTVTQTSIDAGEPNPFAEPDMHQPLKLEAILMRYNNNVGQAENAILRVHQEVDMTIERWLLEIIPMIGFLGTVVGMIAAMDLVGNVVSARPGSELNAAMAAITNALSVAFFTTFIGLVSALLLGIWQAQSAASEVRTVRDFLHPELRDKSATKRTHSKKKVSTRTPKV